jgi:hypothetical protein
MKKIIVILLLLPTVWACNDLLEKTDLTGVDERIWDTESSATLYLNRIYDIVMPVFPSMRSSTTLPTGIHTISDESNTGDNKPLYGNVDVDHVTDFWGNNNTNAWNSIRRINITLTEIEKGALDGAAKNKIKGQAYFMRAWVYFNLMKMYGGIPIIDKVQDWVNDDLFVERSKTSECLEFIVGDLDQAIALLEPGLPWNQASGERGRITRDVAMAVKGRVLLYWASPQFNPADDITRWERAYQANKASYDSLISHGAALYSSFANVLIEEGNANKEVIMIRSFDGANKPNNFENGARPVSESSGGGGSFHPTWEMVKAFPMSDGTPSMENGVAVNGFDTLYYWKNRDPRFAATIAYNGSVWELSGKIGRKQWTYINVDDDKSKQTATGFYCRKGVNAKTLALNAPQGTADWIEMRLAEVMLNLAECANATDRRPEAYTLLTAIRQRAGITNGNGTYGLDPAMDRTAMFKAILDERQYELAFEGKRYDDLRRTRQFHLLNGKKRNALLIKANNIGTLEAVTTGGVKFRETIDINGADYTTYFTPTFKTLDTEAIEFLEKYYFYAIPKTNIDRNPKLLQTKDWTNGTFDPLE